MSFLISCFGKSAAAQCFPSISSMEAMTGPILVPSCQRSMKVPAALLKLIFAASPSAERDCCVWPGNAVARKQQTKSMIEVTQRIRDTLSIRSTTAAEVEDRASRE